MQHDFPVVACAPSRSHAKHTHRMLPVSYLQNAISQLEENWLISLPLPLPLSCVPLLEVMLIIKTVC